tara:strand:+ start:798 stop:1841 length:1044 start_codon:yes stop_codon:yes gene_type:complete
MKRLLLIPTHPGVDSMTWAWMLSQSPNLYNVKLPSHQFIGISDGPYGSYPNIEEDFFSTNLCANDGLNEVNEAGEKSEGFSQKYYIGGILQDFENRNSRLWADENELKTVFNELISELNKADDIPGLVIVVPSWMHSAMAITIAEQYNSDKVSVKTVLVKSNLREDKHQRLFFLKNSFGDEDVDVDTQLLDFVNAELKQNARSWDCRVNAGDVTNLTVATQAFTDLNLVIPDNIKELVARAKQHIDSITPSDNDPFEGGIQNFEWDEWLDKKDPAMLFDQNLSLHMLYLGDENLPPIHKTTEEIEAKQQADRATGSIEFPNPAEINEDDDPYKIKWPDPANDQSTNS